MPSKEHENKIEEIEREIKSRSMDWKTKRNYPVWMQQDNIWGMIDIVGLKKQTNLIQAEVEGYEIEESNGALQQKRNLEKLNQFSKSFPSDVKVRTCQITTQQNHKTACFKNNFPKKPMWRIK